MSYDTWWEHFDTDPHEKVGRSVPGDFGHPVTIQLARISWAYLDWYAETYGGDPGAFFRHNIELYDPREGDIHEWMEGAVSKTYLWEEKHGRPRPSWCPAATPAQYMDIDD